MSCVHYKFKSSLDYQSVTFDGIHISLGDLKKAIINQKRMKSGEFDLEITNAQNGEVYKTEDELIPKNSSVIVSRVPVKPTAVSNTQKQWEAFKEQIAKAMKQEREQEQMSLEKLKETGDLANAKASEMDKIKAMIDQSTKDFDPANYRGGKHPTGPPPPGYHCHRCGKPGHYIQNCTAKMDDNKMMMEPRFKRSTGIPASFLTLTDDPTQPGALLTHTGQFAVPTIDAAAYAQGKKERPPFLPDPVDEEPKPQRPPVPKELLCSLCNNLLTDAVLIPCCGISYCDECIRTTLLDSEDRQCPACYKTEVSPDNLIANVQLRTAVVNFLNETGYTAAMFKKKEASPASVTASPHTPPSKSSTPTMSQMEEVRHEMERNQQYRSSSPTGSTSSRRSRSDQRGRPLTVLGPSGSSSPSDHNSRPHHRSNRERYPPRSSSSYQPHHHHQRNWSDRGQYPGSQGIKTEPLLPRTSALPPLIPTAPQFTSAPPLLPNLAFPPRPMLPVPQPPPPGVTAAPPTYSPAVPPPYTAPPPTVVPSQVAPYAAPPFTPSPIPGVTSRPPPNATPLTEQEFYREKQRLMESNNTDVYEEFAKFVNRNTKGNRPRSRSASPGSNSTARRRSRSYSRSRSRTPSPSRSFRSSRSSLKRSRSPRSRSPRPLTPRSRTSRSPSYSPIRSRSRGRLRTRSRSRTPLRSSSRSPRSRGSKRYRSRSRSFSRSPAYRSSRRSRSRSRARGRSPGRRGYRSSSLSRSRSRSRTPRYSRSSSRSPQRRRSPLRYRKRSPTLSRSRSRSPFKEPLGAPTRPPWRFRSPPPNGNRNFPPPNMGPRYQPPGGPGGPFPNGPAFNYQGQGPMQRPFFGGDMPSQFPNMPGHPGPIPLMQLMPRGPRPPFDRPFYDNRGGLPPFGGPGANSPPRAKSPFRSRMPGDRRDGRNRDMGDRRDFGRRDGQDRRDMGQRREAVPSDRREGNLKRKADVDNAAAVPGGESSSAGQAAEPKPKKVRKVKKKLVDGKKENKEGPSEKDSAGKKEEKRVTSKSRHSSGASQDKLQERKVVVSQDTQASRPSKPSAEKVTPPPGASAKDSGNSKRQVVKADKPREQQRRVVSVSADQAKPQAAAANAPVVAESKTPAISQNSSESAPDDSGSSKIKLKKKKIRVKDPVAAVAAAASAAAASVSAPSGKVDDNQKKLMRLKRFQSDSGGGKGPSSPKKKREPTPPGLGKPMDLRLGFAESRHRDGPAYDMPELSKWERDDITRSPTENFNPKRKVVEKKPLPRSVIEKAESVLANKPLKPSVKPTSGGASPPKPARRVYVEEDGSPKWAESEDRKNSNAMQITVSKTQRRVSESRQTHGSDRQHQDADVRRVAKSDHHKQVTPEYDRRKHYSTSSDSVRKSANDSDHHRRGVSGADHQKKISDSERYKRTATEPDQRKQRTDNGSDRRVESSSDYPKRDSGSVHQKHGESRSDHLKRGDSGSDYQKRGDSNSNYQKQRGDSSSDYQRRSDNGSDRHRPSASSLDLHRRGEDSRQTSDSASRDKASHSHSSREAKKTDSVPSSSKPAAEAGKVPSEEKAPAAKEEKPPAAPSAEEIPKPKESKSYLFDRKESMMDEATFEPDYDESGSESSMEETTTAGELVSTQSSGTDQSSASPGKRGVQSQDASSAHHKKSKKKHKHKSKHKHKHKKKKHKKNKDRDAESENA